MLINLLLAAALTVVTWSLWVRRRSFRCRNEGAPTLIVATGGLAALLTSEPGTSTVGTALHHVTGIWHCDDFIGHLLAVVCISAAVYMCLIRLGDRESVRVYYTTWVVLPLSVLIPMQWAAFAMSDVRDQYISHLEDLQPDGWLAVYWTLLAATMIYLLLIACRIVRVLRADRDHAVLNLWMLSFAMAIVFILAFEFHVVTPFDIRGPVWVLGYTCLALWSFTPAYSWIRRSRPLIIPDAISESRLRSLDE